MRYFLILLIASVFLPELIMAQEEWKVPDEKSKKRSAFKFNDSIVHAGEQIFINNCKSCHGIPGQNDYQPLNPIPGDPASNKFQANSDGDFFFKITNGRGQMPSFNSTLSQNDIWNVISYIRSFNKKYVQEIAKELKRYGYDGDINILLSYLNVSKEIQVKIQGVKKGIPENLENVEVKLAVGRYFGTMQIDEIKSTNAEGLVKFSTPLEIPGDSSGLVKIIAQLNNTELFGEVKKDSLLAFGNPTYKPSLTKKRAMWNVAKKSPLWVMISYLGGVLLVWGVIFYILFQLKAIFKIGKETETNKN